MAEPKAPRAPLRRRLRRHWRTLVSEHATPNRLGVAIGIGVFFGASPFYGLQIFLCIVTAMVLRLNKLAMLAGAQISAPPMTPFLIYGSLQLGERLLNGRWLSLGFAEFRDRPTGEVLKESALAFGAGALVIASILGVSLGVISARAIAANRRRTTGGGLPDEERDALLVRAEALPRALESYFGWKTWLDPVYPLALAALADRKDVVDLGAGPGILEALHAARAPQSRIRAVEWDERKAAAAAKLCAGLPNVTVEQGDARTAGLGTPDALVLLDVLHYHPKEEQLAWLDRCIAALAPGGVLVLRELEHRGGGSVMSERLERVAVRLGWNRGPGVTPLDIDELQAHLERRGLSFEAKRCGRGLFRSNVLIIARKP